MLETMLLNYVSTEMHQNRTEVNLWMKRACSVQLWEDVSYLYTPAADTYLLPSAEAVACTARSAGG